MYHLCVILARNVYMFNLNPLMKKETNPNCRTLYTTTGLDASKISMPQEENRERLEKLMDHRRLKRLDKYMQ